MKLCCECMDQAVRHLTIESGTIFLIQLMGYDNNRSDIMDGPYVATSLAAAKRATRKYYDDEPAQSADFILANGIICRWSE